MNDYIAELEKDGYIPIRTQYYREQDAAYPALRPTPNSDENNDNAIKNQDMRSDEDDNEEDNKNSTDKTLEDNSQTQDKETSKDSPTDPKDSDQENCEDKQPTPDNSNKDESSPADQEPTPKTPLEILLATKVTPPLADPTTPEDSTNDETHPDKQVLPPKTQLVIPLNTKVSLPTVNPPNKSLITSPLPLQSSAKSKLPEPFLPPKTPEHPFFSQTQKAQPTESTQPQSLSHMELPLLKLLKEDRDFKHKEIKNYALQGIKVRQVTFTDKSDKDLPVMSPFVLKA